MKRILVILIFITTIFTCQAQGEKVAERSAKKTPAWLGLSNADNFSVSATAPTLDAAQKKCLEEIRQYIVTSIAANITSTEQLSQEQTSRNGLVSLLSRYASQVETQAAEMPYLCGISLSHALDIYWERRYVKADKSYYYICYVQYPFTEAERREAIAEFRRIDDGYYARLQAIKRNFDTFTELGYIEQAITELNPLIAYFFDTNRRNEAEGLQQQYRKACNEIAIVCDSAALGSYQYHLTLLGRRVTTDKQPQLKSDYATDMRVLKDGDSYLLLYDEAGIEGEENRIEMTYSFGGRPLRHTIVFNPMEDKVAIRPFGTIVVESVGNDLRWQVSITLRAGTDNSFEIRSAEVRIPELGTALRAETLNASFKGKGTHTLRFEADAPLTGAKSVLAKGTLQVYNPMTKITTDLVFTLPYKIIINR